MLNTRDLWWAVKILSTHYTLAITVEMLVTLYHSVIMLSSALMMKTMMDTVILTVLAHIAEDGGTKVAVVPQES